MVKPIFSYKIWIICRYKSMMIWIGECLGSSTYLPSYSFHQVKLLFNTIIPNFVGIMLTTLCGSMPLKLWYRWVFSTINMDTGYMTCIFFWWILLLWISYSNCLTKNPYSSSLLKYLFVDSYAIEVTLKYAMNNGTNGFLNSGSKNHVTNFIVDPGHVLSLEGILE